LASQGDQWKLCGRPTGDPRVFTAHYQHSRIKSISISSMPSSRHDSARPVSCSILQSRFYLLLYLLTGLVRDLRFVLSCSSVVWCSHHFAVSQSRLRRSYNHRAFREAVSTYRIHGRPGLKHSFFRPYRRWDSFRRVMRCTTICYRNQGYNASTSRGRTFRSVDINCAD
jgi:hypothetical protein